MRYEFRVADLVSDTLAEAFPELRRAAMSDQTLFYGTVIDEAHLYGLLNRFQPWAYISLKCGICPNPLLLMVNCQEFRRY